MTVQSVDIVIVGAGPVGLMCAYLGQLCGLSTVTLDRSAGPLAVGRADALNARTLQLLEVIDLFKKIYPLGKTCNTSSVWAKGQFISRQSAWWDNLEGCLHKHFLMLGQSHVEQLLDHLLRGKNAAVQRLATVVDVRIDEDGCTTYLANGCTIRSKYVIGADGSRSFIRERFNVPFEVVRPQLIWAVIDGVIETDFPKVPEIIVFQGETSDVAWIPREGAIDRFYVRMDTKDFTVDEVITKINRAILPHTLRFTEIAWFSNFSVKESVAEQFAIADRVFLVGDACHIHSVNGGQGLNTGLADAFNLIWKLSGVIRNRAGTKFLRTYERERKPVALSVIEAAGELVRSTQYSVRGTHALDYVETVRKRAGNITGMGIRYGAQGLPGSRLFDCEVYEGAVKTRLYSLLKYTHFTLFLFGESQCDLNLHEFVNVIRILPRKGQSGYWTETAHYKNQAILVRPDSYIASATPLNEFEGISDWLDFSTVPREGEA